MTDEQTPKAPRRQLTNTDRLVRIRDAQKRRVDDLEKRRMRLESELADVQAQLKVERPELERIELTLPEDKRLLPPPPIPREDGSGQGSRELTIGRKYGADEAAQ